MVGDRDIEKERRLKSQEEEYFSISDLNSKIRFRRHLQVYEEGMSLFVRLFVSNVANCTESSTFFLRPWQDALLHLP
jgi:hypothetical protein